MSIDTEIKGDPGSITGAASWLTGSLGSSATDAGASAAAAGRVPGWEGVSAAAVGAWAGQAEDVATTIARTATTVARTLTDFADALRDAQREMKEVRAAAAAADLDVAGFVIADPGPGPARPAPLPRAVGGLKISAHTRDQHAAATALWEEHQAKVKAYEKAERDAERVRTGIEAAGASLSGGGAGVGASLGAAVGSPQSGGNPLLDPLKGAGALKNGFAAYADQKTENLLEANRRDFDRHWDRQVNHNDPFAQKYMDRNLERRAALKEGAERLGKVVRPVGLVLDGIGLRNDIREGKPVEDIIGGKIGGAAGGAGAAAAAAFLTGGNPIAVGVAAGVGSTGGEILGEKVAGPLVDGAKFAWDHPLVLGPVGVPKVALDHVDDAVGVAGKVADTAVDTAREAPVVGGLMKKLDL